MRVSRFGFGRSVSGSVYSEGRMLSHDDCKTYWGEITETRKENRKDHAINDADATRLEVKGSVIFGGGLEPTPIGQFIMRELEHTDAVYEEEAENGDEKLERLLNEQFSSQENRADQGIDWTGEGFQ